MKYCVYLLRSERGKGVYVGQTQDITKRLAQHNAGRVKSTCSRRPWKLVGYEVYETRAEARYREFQLKNHSDKKREFVRRMEGVEK